jgi:hypothetical protein
MLLESPTNPKILQFLHDVADIYNEAGYLTVAFGHNGIKELRESGVAIAREVGENAKVLADIKQPLCVFLLDWDRFDTNRQAIKSQRRHTSDVFVRWWPYSDVTF